jgi:hypothetical protein
MPADFGLETTYTQTITILKLIKKERRCGDGRSIELAENEVHWQAVVNDVEHL